MKSLTSLALRLAPIAAAAWLLAAPAAAHAAPGPGVEAVRGANDTVRDLLRQEARPGSARERELAGRVTREVRGFLDVEELGRAALADHWPGLDPARRTRYTELLRALIERNYIEGLRANLEYEVVYAGERAEGDGLRVTTEVKARRRGRPHSIAVEYLLRRDGSSWRAVDVVTDGVGLVENYRAQFNRIIAREGFDGLLARMEKRLAAD